MSSFRHSGEIGDLCFLLPVLRAIGGKHSIFLADRVKVPPFSRPIVAAAPIITPLLLVQPYIQEVRCTEDPCDIDMSKFRVFHTPNTTLTSAQVAYYNDQAHSQLTEDGSTPWLCIDRGRKPSGRVVIARSSRYNNPLFPWKEVVAHYSDRLLFIGLGHEHKAFSEKYGKVKHAKIKDFLELARLIVDAELFIGNQSGPQAVAMGLGGPIIQETFIHQTDCVFNRRNAQYCYDGACVLPDVSGSGELKINSATSEPDLTINRNVVPPGQWQYPGAAPMSHFSELSRVVMQLSSCTLEEADKRILLHNVRRCPDFYNQGTDPNHNAMIAINNAGLNGVLR